MRNSELFLTLSCVLLIGGGQILFKIAARDAEFHGFTWRTLTAWLSPAMVSALAIYVVATFVWVFVLRTADLALVYPLYALAFIVVPILAFLVFGDPISPRQWGGAALIIAGVWLMAAARA